MKPIKILVGEAVENHLASLPHYCATLCEIECCGLDACDLSSIHIASYCQSRDARCPKRVASQISEQAKTLKANYGSKGASARGTTIIEINERMSGERVDTFAAMLIQQTSLAENILETEETDDRCPIRVWGQASRA